MNMPKKVSFSIFRPSRAIALKKKIKQNKESVFQV